MAETRKNFNQMLRVLIHAAAGRMRRIDGVVLVVIRRRDGRLASRRSERQMDHVRRNTGMPHERRMQLKRQICARNDGMDRQHVRARPGTRRLACGRSTVDRHV